MESYTEFMYTLATSPQLTLQQAVESLRRDAHIRTVRETLSKATGISMEDRTALQKVITNALMDTDPGSNRDSVARKVRVWLSDDVRFVRKDSAIQLCFALGLSLKESENLMYRLCGEGFHWRNPRDIVFIYACEHEWTYSKAMHCIANWDGEGLLKLEAADLNVNQYTGDVKELVRQINTEEELKEFLIQNKQNLGMFRNTAYQLFCDFLDLLKNPEEVIYSRETKDTKQTKKSKKEIEEEKERKKQDISVKNIMEHYLYECFLPRLRRATPGNNGLEESVLFTVQEDIRQNWPDETTLSRMRKRRIDVSRKVLILLFLATDGGFSRYADQTDDATFNSSSDPLEEMTEEEIFEDMYVRMNNMLIECGFSPLDSRAPFDWMILYCMCAEESMFIDGRMQHFLSEMFPKQDAEFVFPDGGPEQAYDDGLGRN